MTAIVVGAIILMLAVQVAWARRRQLGRGRPHPPNPRTRRILFPFVASDLSLTALDAALRLARAEEATVLPVFLTRVPLTMPLDAPLQEQPAIAIALQEAIEHHAATFSIPIEARIARGRTYRHALREAMTSELFDRIVIAAANPDRPGFGPDDVAWLLRHAQGEIVVLRPGNEDHRLAGPKPIRPITQKSSDGIAPQSDDRYLTRDQAVPVRPTRPGWAAPHQL